MNSAFKSFKKGARVKDMWYPDWGIGTVVWRGKTRLHVLFFGNSARRWTNSNGIMIWDAPHVRQLLRVVK